MVTSYVGGWVPVQLHAEGNEERQRDYMSRASFLTIMPLQAALGAIAPLLRRATEADGDRPFPFPFPFPFPSLFASKIPCRAFFLNHSTPSEMMCCLSHRISSPLSVISFTNRLIIGRELPIISARSSCDNSGTIR